MSDFEREERYIVVKRKHLTPFMESSIRNLLAALDVPTIEGAVVEVDWPEYEPVWNMIEARCTAARRELDPILLQIVALFLGKGEYSACSHAQRKLGIGYNQAARHIETLEAAGVLSPANNVGKRQLLVATMREAQELLHKRAPAK